MLRRIRASTIAAVAIALAVLAPLANAQESFQVLSVDTVGCNSGEFRMTVQRANLDGGTYTVRTVVTVGALVYMNENASISINGTSNWSVLNNFSYGSVPNPGTYPIPSGQTMTLDFSLERPVGTILYRWRLVVDGCDTGTILFNGPLAVAGPSIPVPIDPWLALALALALAGLAGRRLARR